MRILEEVYRIAKSFNRADSIIRGAIVGAAWGARLPEIQAAAIGDMKAMQVGDGMPMPAKPPVGGCSRPRTVTGQESGGGGYRDSREREGEGEVSRKREGGGRGLPGFPWRHCL